jgi:hypothetical protein
MKEIKLILKKRAGVSESDTSMFDYLIDSYPTELYELECQGDSWTEMIFYGEDPAAIREMASGAADETQTDSSIQVRELPPKEWAAIKARLDEHG